MNSISSYPKIVEHFSSDTTIFIRLCRKRGTMDISMDSIGNRIRERRKELRLTQTDMHRECGITSGALSQIENGSRVPSAIAFYSISQALNCSMEYLMTGTSSETKNTEIFGNEKKLLDGFQKLPEEDQEELLEILEMKLRKVQRARGTSAKSSDLTDTEKGDMVG